MVEHPAGGDFERFVRGELGGRDGARFEGHVAGCAQCAARLAREARLELGLCEVAERGPRGSRGGRTGAALAAASASLLALGAAIAALAPGAPRAAGGAGEGTVALAPQRPPAASLGLRSPSRSPLDGAEGVEGAP